MQQLQKPKQGYKLVKSLFGKYEEIPEDWIVDTVDRVGEIKGRVGWRGYTQNDFVEKGKGSISLGANNITEDNQLNFKNLTYVTWQKYEESPEIQVTEGDIIIAQRGSIGKVALIHDLLEKTTINPNVVLLKNILSNNMYLYYFLTSFYIQKQMISITSSTTIPLLTQSQIKSFKILIPAITEQQKIASILSNVDFLIQQTQKEIKQTQRLKKGLMQRLLTKGFGHTKFKKVKWILGKNFDVPFSWELSKLKHYTILITKGSSPNWQGISYVNNGTLFITSENIGEGKLILHNKKFVEDRFNDSNKRSLLQRGDILTNIVGASIGRTSVYNLNVKANINQAVALIRLGNDLLSDYLVNFLNNPKFIQYLIHGTGETARPNLSLTDVSNFPILIPPLEEQQKIASILSNVDFQIQKQQEYKSKIETLKKGLMQKLLTGQIRVKV